MLPSSLIAIPTTTLSSFLKKLDLSLSSNQKNMHSFVQWLGGTKDAGSNGFLFCLPTQRILFKASEGTQRVCAEHGIRIAGNSTETSARLTSIWIDSLRWDCIGGLAGFLATVADVGTLGVKLFGPPGLHSVVCGMRPFLQRDNFDLQIHEIDSEEWITDGEIRVKPIIRTTELEVRRKLSLGWEISNLSKMFPSRKSQEAALPRNRVDILGWWVSGPKRLGKFDVQRAKALGIPVGPLYGKLQKGESVEWEGKTFHPADCVATPEPTPVILYLKEACQLDKACLTLDQALNAVFHDYPNPRKTGLSPLEFVTPKDGSLELIMLDSYKQCREMSSEYPILIPQVKSHEYELSDGLLPVTPLMKLHLVPRVEVETWMQADRLVEQTAMKRPRMSAEPKITFLGTGSCIPGRYRNVSSIHLGIEDGVLLDCGEGTEGQLQRAGLAPPKIICITHQHADHHLGTIAFLQPGTTLIAPRRFISWIREYFETSLPDVNLETFTFVECEKIQEHPFIAGDTKFYAFRVDHCQDAFGFSLRTKDGTVVYSGDTRPCDAVVQAAKNVDLLIHECTLTDDLQHEARARKHTCLSEAIDIVKKATPKRTIFTHFSQRTAKGIDPEIQRIVRATKLPIRLAVDFMQVSLFEK